MVVEVEKEFDDNEDDDNTVKHWHDFKIVLIIKTNKGGNAE